jgi:hypothetical protein
MDYLGSAGAGCDPTLSLDEGWIEAKTVNLVHYWPPPPHIKIRSIPVCPINSSFLLPRSLVRTQNLRFKELHHADLQHCVYGILWVRAPLFTHSPVVTSRVVKCWGVRVHDLGSTWLPRIFRELHCVEREYRQLGTRLVRYRAFQIPPLNTHAY